MPPLFVLGPEGGAELVDSGARRSSFVVDRLFAAAELRLGGDHRAEGSHRAHRREAAMVSGDPLEAERELADDLRLHPRRPPVTRLSRKVLVGLAGVAIFAVLAAASSGRSMAAAVTRKRQNSELYNTERKTTADELAKLPRDYSGLPTGVPPLGPPLPGDFGRANVQQHGPQGVDPEQQRVAQETEAARTSRLFSPSTTVNRAMPSPAPTTANTDRDIRSCGRSAADRCKLDPEHAGSQSSRSSTDRSTNAR